jgi:hypothetical protein
MAGLLVLFFWWLTQRHKICGPIAKSTYPRPIIDNLLYYMSCRTDFNLVMQVGGKLIYNLRFSLQISNLFAIFVKNQVPARVFMNEDSTFEDTAMLKN